MWTSHHCRHCHQKHIKLKPIGIKKRSDKQIMDGTVAYLKDTVSGIVRRSTGCTEYWTSNVTAEDIARHLRVRTHLVKQALHKLNLQGVVSKPYHTPPHDSTRDRHVAGYDSAWCASRYAINREKLNEL